MAKTSVASQPSLARAGQRSITATHGSLRGEALLTNLASHLILALFTVVIVYPVLWMLLASFKSNSEIVTNVRGLPQT
jgi:ABC-type glycerol-3-phosphate transport system permease component